MREFKQNRKYVIFCVPYLQRISSSVKATGMAHSHTHTPREKLYENSMTRHFCSLPLTFQIQQSPHTHSMYVSELYTWLRVCMCHIHTRHHVYNSEKSLISRELISAAAQYSNEIQHAIWQTEYTIVSR